MKGEKGGNGHVDKANVVADLKEYEEFIHSQASTDKAFSSTETVNAMKIMMSAEAEFADNAFRYDLPNNRIILAMALGYQRAKKHNDDEIADSYKLLCGLLTSKRGKRTQMLSDTIIGDRKFRENAAGGGNGFMAKAKSFITGT